MRSTPAWLAWQTGLGRGQVSRAIDTADLAELLPTMGEAWRAGRVSTNAMETIAAARVPGHDEKLAACEEEFFGLARRGDHTGVRRAAEAFKHLARADGTMPIEPDGLRLSKVLDGRTNISGELSSDAAETVTTALNAFMDPPSETDAPEYRWQAPIPEPQRPTRSRPDATGAEASREVGSPRTLRVPRSATGRAVR